MKDEKKPDQYAVESWDMSLTGSADSASNWMNGKAREGFTSFLEECRGNRLTVIMRKKERKLHRILAESQKINLKWTDKEGCVHLIEATEIR